MIPELAITAWRGTAPWAGNDQVEHDLVLSRAICELYKHPLTSEKLVFRGGTALHKLFFEKAGRFSDDLDFVQAKAEPIGVTVNAIRECLDHWLGSPSWKQSQGRFTLYYKFTTEIEPVVTRKVKVEINTREHCNAHPHAKISYKVNNRWFSAECEVLTYIIEELLATKLRALYQRRKGRDLYDFWYVCEKYQSSLNYPMIINIFNHYLANDDIRVSPKEYERNILLKQNDIVFRNDLEPLLSVDSLSTYSLEKGFENVFKNFIDKYYAHRD